MVHVLVRVLVWVLVYAGVCTGACVGACAGAGAWDPSAEEVDVGESRVQGQAGVHNKILSKIK